MREASYWAREDDKTVVTAEHVKRAEEEKYYRSNLIEVRVREKFGLKSDDTITAAEPAAAPVAAAVAAPVEEGLRVAEVGCKARGGRD